MKSKAGTSSAARGTPASGSSPAQTPATSEETSTDDIDGCDTDNDERYFSKTVFYREFVFQRVFWFGSKAAPQCLKTEPVLSQAPSYKLKHACLTRPFIEGATQKGQRKEHCMCIKQKQNISSQSLLRNPSTLKSSFQFVCHRLIFFLRSTPL